MDQPPSTDRSTPDAATIIDQRDALARALVERSAERRRWFASRAYRCIQSVAAARGRPRAWLALPRVLWRILKDRPAATGNPVPVPMPAPWPALPDRPMFKIAAIVDDFTALGMQGECELLRVPPGADPASLREFAPDLLLVESAWKGNGGAWTGRLVPASDELLALLWHCRGLGVPTVFWNKEDPSHFEHFLETARHFDHVLTTDGSSVAAYRERMGGRAVGVMAFACQPRIHHPVETGPRQDAVLFAGSYYARYPGRMRDFERLLDALPPGMPVHIYDRNLGRNDEAFRFPERYQPMIRGRLPPESVHEAYRAYKYAINLNTITDSPTMLSRRVLELMACNTLVLSNASRAMREAFGSAVLENPDASALAETLADPLDQERRCLAGLRAVMLDHTWRHRIAQLRDLVLPGGVPMPALPGVVVIAAVNDAAAAGRLVTAFRAQSLADKQLLLVAPSEVAAVFAGQADVGWLTPAQASVAPIPSEQAAVSVWHALDAYGPNYLLDLALVPRYWPAAEAAGKAGQGEAGYRLAGKLPWRSSVVFQRARLPATIAELVAQAEAAVLEGGQLLLADRFNYARGTGGLLPDEARDKA